MKKINLASIQMRNASLESAHLPTEPSLVEPPPLYRPKVQPNQNQNQVYII